MNTKTLFLLISSLFTFIHASSSGSDSSSSSSVVSDSSSAVDDEIQPPCLQCPSPAKFKKSCKKGKKVILTERTCYTCPKYKCVKKKYLKEGGGKICKKIMPVCSKANCDSDETCLITVQTPYACPEAKCIKRLLNRNRLEDHENYDD